MRQTDGVAPREAAVDAVFQVVRAAAPADPIIFNCQMGAGRTTTGMVIACLTRTFTTGAPPGLMRAFMTGAASCLARTGGRPARARASGGAGGRRARPPAGCPQRKEGLPWGPVLARRRAATLRSPRPNWHSPLTGVMQRRLLFAGAARLRVAWRDTALRLTMYSGALCPGACAKAQVGARSGARRRGRARACRRHGPRGAGGQPGGRAGGAVAAQRRVRRRARPLAAPVC